MVDWLGRFQFPEAGTDQDTAPEPLADGWGTGLTSRHPSLTIPTRPAISGMRALIHRLVA